MKINAPSVVVQLQELAQLYERALMDNDLAALDAMFWQSPHVVRFGAEENLYGIAEIAAFRTARAGSSPQRVVLRTSVSGFGDDFGVINVEFRRRDGTLGRQSQTWARLSEGWPIVSARVSLMAAVH